MSFEFVLLLAVTNGLTYYFFGHKNKEVAMALARAVAGAGVMPIVLAYRERALLGLKIEPKIEAAYKEEFLRNTKKFPANSKGNTVAVKEECDCPDCVAERGANK